MNGIRSIVRKELADHFSSYRFIILFALIAMVSLITVYMVYVHLCRMFGLKPAFCTNRKI